MNAAKRLLCLLPGLVALGWTLPAMAQDWPKAAVRMIAPYPAGGGGDILLRKIAEKLADKWKQPVIVDNRPGAVEIPATRTVIQAKPDGYTLLMSTEVALETNQFLYSNLPYDPVKDLTPITRLTEAALVYVVRSDSPYQTLPQLLAAAKAQPDKLTYATNGIGGNVHIAINWLALQAGLQMRSIPYKGSAPQMQALVGGEIDFTLLPAASIASFVASKRARPLATSGAVRIRSMPDVPTTTELGYKDTVVHYMLALSGPAGLPADIAGKIARDVGAVLKDPEFAAANLEPHGYLPVGDTPEEFARFLAVDREKQRERIKAANVKLD